MLISLLVSLAGSLAAAEAGLRLASSFDATNRVLTVAVTSPMPGLFTIESSTDLVQWSHTAASAAPGPQFEFVQSNLFANPFRFFRARLEQPFVTNQVLVRFNPNVSPGWQNEILGSVGATNIETILTRAMQTNGLEPIIRARANAPVLSTVQALRANTNVNHAEPVWLAWFSAAPNDPHFINGNQWGLYGEDTTPANPFGSQAATAWAAGYTGSSSVCVGIIDTGIHWQHPDLAPNLWSNPGEIAGNNADDDFNQLRDDTNGWDFVYNDASVNDGSSSLPLTERHGTAVAGIIGGVGGNGQGIAGVNWRVSLIPAKVGEGSSIGDYTAGTFPVVQAIKALDYLTDLKSSRHIPIAVINASWGLYSYDGFLHEALNRAARADILIVAAAGNDGMNIDALPPETGFYPASADTSVTARLSSGQSVQSPATFNAMIAVAAIDPSGQLAAFGGGRRSNFGSGKVALGAPGQGIVTTVPPFPNEYERDEGTSFAAPFVSGAIALYKSAYPTATALQIKQVLLNAAAATAPQMPWLSGMTSTGGRLDIAGMLAPRPGCSSPDCILFVNLGYTGTLENGCPATPYKTVTGAYGVAQDGCVFKIAPGTYAVGTAPLPGKAVLFEPTAGNVLLQP